MNHEAEIIRGCIKGDGRQQRRLYELYSPRMFGICLRYAQDEDDASDILQEGFIKVFTKLSEFRHEGSFEGWIRRIVVNTAINHCLKNKKHQYHYDLNDVEELIEDEKASFDPLQVLDLLKLVRNLPPGYRTVFNLYEIEGFAHKEIAEMMGISINTSKTQLMHARRLLQKRLIRIETIPSDEVK
ncbi:MAG: RNA polymerase sigma factor [Bacteroidales bacterium]|jgi:RNA polymerase sigma-70 factor (ECF subfamily)|nr:RNA polymerase sigma factor [Bacteroidales bacterium]